MITTTEYILGYWSVQEDGSLRGYINETGDGKFAVRHAVPGGHIGGVAPLASVFATLALAQASLIPPTITPDPPRHEADQFEFPL